jgi:hypothetical protein
VVGDELDAPEVNDFTKGENIALQMFTIHSDYERR